MSFSDSKNEIPRIGLQILFFAFLLLYTGILIFLAHDTVTWEDELYSLHTSSQDFLSVIKESYYFEGQPPVYYVLLHLWRLISGSLFFARLFSVLLVLFSGYFVYRICLEYLNRTASLQVLVLYLLNPIIIGISIDVRAYSLVLLFSSLSVFLFIRTYLDEGNRNGLIILHAIVTLLGSYTQYLFVFLVIGQAIVLMSRGDWRKFRQFFLWQSAVAILFSLNLFFVRDQIDFHSNHEDGHTLYVRQVVSSLNSFIFPYNPFPGGWFGKRIFIIIYSGWICYLMLNRKTSFKEKLNKFKPTLFLLLLGLFTAFSIFVLFQISQLVYYERYVTLVLPSLFLFFILTLTPGGKRLFNIWFALLGVYYLISAFNIHGNLVKERDYKSAASFIEKQAPEEIPLLFYPFNYAIPFDYYYTGSNQVVQLPTPLEYSINPEKSYKIEDEETLKSLFEKDFSSWSELIYVTERYDDSNCAHLNYCMVDSYLHKHFLISRDTILIGNSSRLGLRIRWLTRLEVSE